MQFLSFLQGFGGVAVPSFPKLTLTKNFLGAIRVFAAFPCAWFATVRAEVALCVFAGHEWQGKGHERASEYRGENFDRAGAGIAATPQHREQQHAVIV